MRDEALFRRLNANATAATWFFDQLHDRMVDSGASRPEDAVSDDEANELAKEALRRFPDGLTYPTTH